MKLLTNSIEQLYRSLRKTPQEQLTDVIDISRRGLLKQVLAATTYGIAMGSCTHNVFADGVSGLPDLGDTDRSNLSPYQASLLGKQVILSIYSHGSMLEDFDALDYLNKLGNEFVSYSPLAGQEFNFYLIKDKEINAFALPGGYICANNGLIYTTLSEAELSGVMAHEVGHVVQHHIFRNLSVQNRAQWTSVAGLIAGALLAAVNPGLAVVAAQGGQGLGIQNMLSFSRDYEREADRVGQNLMYKAGFDAHAMPEFFQRMQNAYRFNSNDAFAFLQTHPVTLERLSEAETRANQLPVKMRQDSIDFLLVREKCRVRQIGNDGAIKFYNEAISKKRYVSLDAQLYGLSLAKFLNKSFADSKATLNKISSSVYKSNPIVIGLKARQLIIDKSYDLADKLYDAAIHDYPRHKGLWMGQLELFLVMKNYVASAHRLDILVRNFPEDPDVWDQYAILYSDVRYDNAVRYHYGLGTEYFVLGNYKGALDQYQASLKSRPKMAGDDVIHETVSSRIPMVIRAMKS
ncbi:MAG: M48 family metalloprotease [Burkholderiales bacterium]|nr:M48 family metalloprotease [Burkholderiales bacterium]